MEGRQPLGSFLSCDGNLSATWLEFRRDLLVLSLKSSGMGGRVFSDTLLQWLRCCYQNLLCGFVASISPLVPGCTKVPLLGA